MEKQVAILIDGDNISPKFAEYIKQEAMRYGNVRIMRLYGTVNSGNVKAWYNIMPVHGVVPVLQISYAQGKSIADQALTIDAMDMLYTNELDVFCIVSSDSDYVKLVYRLKEAGKLVIGMGEKKTRETLANAYDEFIILDLIYKDVDATDEVRVQSISEIIEINAEEAEEIDNTGDLEINIPSEDEIIDDIYDYFDLTEDDKINLAKVGAFLRKTFLGFDARNYGYKNMTKMIENHKDKFVVTREKAPDGEHEIVYISKAAT